MTVDEVRHPTSSYPNASARGARFRFVLSLADRRLQAVIALTLAIPDYLVVGYVLYRLSVRYVELPKLRLLCALFVTTWGIPTFLLLAPL